MADSGWGCKSNGANPRWGCKSNGANPRWGCKSNFDGAVSPMGRYVHTNWGAQYRGAVSPASDVATCLRHNTKSTLFITLQAGSPRPEARPKRL